MTDEDPDTRMDAQAMRWRTEFVALGFIAEQSLPGFMHLAITDDLERVTARFTDEFHRAICNRFRLIGYIPTATPLEVDISVALPTLYKILGSDFADREQQRPMGFSVISEKILAIGTHYRMLALELLSIVAPSMSMDQRLNIANEIKADIAGLFDQMHEALSLFSYGLLTFDEAVQNAFGDI